MTHHVADAAYKRRRLRRLRRLRRPRGGGGGSESATENVEQLKKKNPIDVTAGYDLPG